MMKVVAYVRVSTADQAQEGVSLEAQVKRLEAYCVAQNWPAPEVVEDAGVSAKSLERPGLGRVLEEVRKKRVDVLLVVKLDRLTRSVGDLAPLPKALERGRCELVSLGESLDTSNAAGRLMLNLLVSISQWEREIIAERTREALRHMRREGRAYNHTPLGFERVGEKLERLEGEFALGQSIVMLHQKGSSLNGIARLLNARGVAGKNGGRWHASTVKRVVDRVELYQ